MKQLVLRLLIGGALLLLCLFYLNPSSAQRTSPNRNPSHNVTASVQEQIKQKPIPQLVEDSKRAGGIFERRQLFQSANTRLTSDAQLQQVLSDGIKLSLDHSATDSLLDEKPDFLTLPVPRVKGGTVELELVKVDIFAPGFSVKTSVPTNEPLQKALGVHYRGIVKDNPRSLAAISVFENEIMGFYSSEGDGNTVLGRLKGDNPTGLHVLYDEKDLQATSNFSCDAFEPTNTSLPSLSLPSPQALTTSCVRFYLETEHALFLRKGSVANTTSYVTGLFNQSAALFSNDGISVSISEIFVWNSPSPYNGTTSLEFLDQFQALRTSFNGDLAHLLTIDRNFGGIAFVNVLCNRGAAYAVSDIDATFSNVPTYSWSVNVFTHEAGHNLGSKHTQACVWNGNNTAIDGCAAPEGSCSQPGLPSNGGTMMSYCHLIPGVGINFTLGFGPQPLNVITNRVNGSTCLTGCGGGTPPPAPVVKAATSVTASGFTANWNSASGATGYRLDVSTNSSFSSFVSGFSNLDVGNVLSRSVSGLSGGTTYFYRVRAYNTGGTSNNSATITVLTVPSAPVTKAATSVTGSGFTANWNSASGATGYRLDVSTNSSFSSFVTGFNNLSVGNVLSRSVTGLTAGTTYFYRVRAFNTVGTSNNSVAIAVVTIPLAPVAKAATSVTGSGFTANWNSASGATGYRLDVATNSSFSSFVSGFNNLSVGNVLSRSVTGLSAGTTYFYRVRAFNGNGASGNSSSITVVTSQNFTVTVTAAPVSGGTVTGGGTFPPGSSRTVQATANSGFSFTNWTEGAIVVSTSSSYTFTLNSDRVLVANFIAVGNNNAVYDSVLKVPKCGQIGKSCNSGSLLNGRDTISGGQEPNQPNTLNNSCPDNTSGFYHSDESIDKIVISTVDGSNFAPGKTVKVEATVWAFSTASDFLDLFYAPDATNPNWVFIATLRPSVLGLQTLSTTFTLAQGRNVQAIRANFLFGGLPTACSGGGFDNFDDHDDLAFTIDSGTLPLQLVLEQSGPSSSQAAALESPYMTRDPFAVINAANPFNLPDKNTRVIVFVGNLKLAPGETASAVVVRLVDNNNQTFELAADAVTPVSNFPFTQVNFRLPTNLAVGTCTIVVKAHGQASNAGTIRIH